MTYCGIAGFTSATDVAAMAGFMTAISLMILLSCVAALVWVGRSLFEITMGEHGINWLWLLLGLIGILLMGSLGFMAVPDALCLWGAV